MSLLQSVDLVNDLYDISAKENLRDYKVLDVSEFDFLMSKLVTAKELVFDLETTGLNPFKDSIRLIGFNLLQEKEIYAIPFNLKQRVKLSALLSDPLILKIGQNLNFDIKFLRCQGIDVKGPYFDTLIAHSLLDENSQHNLRFLANKYISAFTGFYNDQKDLYMLTKEAGWSDIPMTLLGQYCCEDVDYTGRFKEIFKDLLIIEQVEAVFDIEMRLLDCMIDMDLAGLTFDLTKLDKVRQEVYNIAANFREQLLKLANKRFRKVNFGSSKQIAEILYQDLHLPIIKRSLKTNAPSTDAEVLQTLAQKHEFPKLLLSYRKIEKIINAYLDSDTLMGSLHNGKVHTHFSQHVTVTGRLSCNEPNLQAIPKETNIVRQLFIASPGYKFFRADYSQIELKILAFCSRDPVMLLAYQQDVDLHKQTAAKLYDIDINQVARKQRNLAKTINFGIIYGMTAVGLANITGIRIKEAEIFIEKYFDIYKGVKVFIDETKKELYSQSEVINYFGRKRRFPNFYFYSNIQRSKAERQVVNFKIQSFAAYIMKLAMIKIYNFLLKNSPTSKILLQLHDELVIELVEEQMSNLVPQIVTLLIEPPVIAFDIPLTVDYSIIDTWGDSSTSSFDEYLGLSDGFAEQLSGYSG
ncbi:hypothetical protein KKF45_05640 [Patescibacteria group bacterium]|nr:hypothetical protein [Patescibacteria group bacterium]